jgi:hypothetical protein
MRPSRVEVTLPLLHQHLGLLERREDLPIEKRVSELAIEGLDGAVLPRTPRLDEEGPHPERGQPGPNHLGGELRPIVRTDELRRPSGQLDLCLPQLVDDLLGCKTLPRHRLPLSRSG